MNAERFLGGKVVARQSERGFRAGLDAVMLAASVPAKSGDRLLELGAGVGTASLCLGARVPGVSILGVEIEPELVQLAEENARVNNFTDLRFAAGDLFALLAKTPDSYDHVFCNPPFHEGVGSPDKVRARALMDEGKLADWIELGLKRTRSGGSFTCILSMSRMAEALAVLPGRGTRAFPLWPRAGVPAKRVILQTLKGSGEGFVLLPGLVLHESGGGYTKGADAVLRDGASLALDSAPL